MADVTAFLMAALLVLTSGAAALKCYRCESNQHLHCSERFDMENANLNPESCDDIFEASYCVKTTGMYEGQIGTKRFCSSRDHGNYCEYISRPGDEREYRSCVYTCWGDGCNSAPARTPTAYLQLWLALIVSLLASVIRL